MLVIRNGVYGDRIAAMADAYRFQTVCLDTPWGEPPVLDDIEQALKQNPNIEVVALVHQKRPRDCSTRFMKSEHWPTNTRNGFW